MSLHDARDVNTQMDTSPIQSTSNTLSLAFSARVPQRPEDPHLQNSMPRRPSRDQVSIFQRSVDPNPLHLPLADTSSTSTTEILSMEGLSPPTSSRAPAPGFISDFPSQNISFGQSSRMDTHLAVHSPQSASSGSGGASSTVHGTYSMSNQSIMSAGQPSIHSVHAGPSGLDSSPSELTFSPLNNGQLKSAQDSGFFFPPPDVADSRFSGRDSSPETPGDSHLLVVGDMLKTIAHTAQSASTACSRGQGLEANFRIDELKKTITLVSDLIAATKIADTPTVSRNPSPRRFSALVAKSSVSPPIIPVTQEQLVSGMHFSTAGDIGTMDVQSNGDISDMSRKRCASSMAGDRVIKAPKREPQEDTPLHIIPPPTNQPPFSSVTVPPVTDPRSMTSYVPANAQSESASRPTSSTGQPSLAGFGLIPSQPPAAAIGFSMGVSSAPPSSTEFISTSPLSTTMPHSAHFPPPPTVRSSWSDGAATLPHHSHQHSLSGSSLNGAINFHTIPSTGSSLGPLPFSTTGTFPSSSQPRPLTTAAGTGITPPIGRVSRSGSFTTSNVNPYTLGISKITTPNALDFLNSAQPSNAQPMGSHSPTSSLEGEHDESDIGSHSHSPAESSGVRATHYSSSSRTFTGHDIRPGPLVTRQSAENLSPTSGHNNEVPQEYRAEVDRIFFEFLNSICSNLDATDGKGEPIHQTLMAKKMQRLDESPDFRPFKFRIQAFTNAFLEELAKQGYPEEKIPMKKIRNYLWNQPYISRFNEDGKKTKSKGNHIWNIDAKKNPDGGWTFRPFHRKVAGSPPGVAYVGLRWSWAPRIWDPQASRANLVVTYNSPSLPSWLFWEDDVLSGTPPPDAESCDITVVARYVQDGQEELLTQTFHLNVVPVSNLDTSFSASRRGSVNGEMHKPRRVASDSTVPQTSPRTLKSQTSTTLAQPVTTRDAQVIQVLTSAAQRVAQEAQSQIISAQTQGEPGPELQALAKQQHVLTITAQAVDQEVTGQRSDIGPQATNMLAVAAQQVVFQAARQVVADRSAAVASQISAGFTPPPVAATQVTVNEVSVATQSAVAQAVEITGPLSNEVDVLMTASSLLQQQFRAPAPVSPISAMLDSAQRPISMDSMRSHSTGTVSYSMNMNTQSAVHFPSAMSSSSLSDYGRLQ